MTTEVLDAQFSASASALEQLPPPLFAEVAFAGRSNVGKSSLINALVGRRKLVRTSNTPGCTRAIQIFRVRLRETGEQAEMDLVDLPGYGYAKRSKTERQAWGPLIEGFLRTRAGLRAVVVIVDARRGVEADDLQLVEFLEHVGVTPVVVATKLDKLPSSKRKPRLSEIGREAGVRVHGFSATDRTGVEELWQTLRKLGAVGAA